MKASDILINKLKSYEQLFLVAYRCPAGVLTIGWGHTKDVKKGQKITIEQAEEFLHADLISTEKAIMGIGVWTQGQFDALVDFAFNCGINALLHSTLLRKIKAHASKEEIYNEFMRWNKSNGKVLNGLTVRRKWEADRFFSV